MAATGSTDQQTGVSTAAGPDASFDHRSIQAQPQAGVADALSAPAGSPAQTDTALPARAALHVTGPQAAVSRADVSVQAVSSLAPVGARSDAAAVMGRTGTMQTQPDQAAPAMGAQLPAPAAVQQAGRVASRDAAVPHVPQASIASQVGMAASIPVCAGSCCQA